MLLYKHVNLYFISSTTIKKIRQIINNNINFNLFNSEYLSIIILMYLNNMIHNCKI